MVTVHIRRILVLVLMANTMLHVEAKDGCKKSLAIGSIIAGVLAGAAAVVGGCYYLFNQTDEQVCNDAEKLLNELEFFEAHIRGFCVVHHINSPYVTLTDITYSEVNELAKIAADFNQKNINMRGYIESLETLFNQLKKSKEILVERIVEREKDNTAENYVLVKHMHALYKSIDERLPYIKLYYTFVYAHRNFFYLYNELEIISAKYAKESNVFIVYNHDPVYLVYALKQLVGTHAISSKFRLIEYRKMLDADIHDIKSLLKYLEYSYPVIYDRANKWIDFIKRVRGVILADYEYTAELAEQRRQEGYDALIYLQHQAALQKAHTTIHIH